MKTILKKTSDIKPYINNPREISKAAIEKVTLSIKEFGFQQPIVVDKNNIIIAGHTRLLAAKQLKLKEVPIIVADQLTENQTKAYRLMDNRSAEDSNWDNKLLKLELGILQENDFNLKLTGFDDSFLTSIPIYERYADGVKGSLREKYVAPPFSILNTTLLEWQERKKYWNDKIKILTETREGVLSDSGMLTTINKGTSVLDSCLCEVVCNWFSKPKFKVFDCFAGDINFGYVSSSCGLEYTGIELRKEQIEVNRKIIKRDNLDAKYIQDDGQNIDKHIKDNSMDLFFTCPPYADLEVYSNNPKDLSTMSYDDFFKVYTNCLSKVYKKLKQNRFAVVVIGEVRNKKTGAYIHLVPKTIDIMCKSGFKFWNEIIMVNAIGTLPLRVPKIFKASRKVGKQHQNVLVFYKGNQKNIKDLF